MKLERVWVCQFQQFRTSVEVAELDGGLNLFIGPNESGKSTLVRAIRAAFFERHRTRTVGHLQPWGDSGAAPEVALAFNWQGERWRLHKRFLQRQRCDLQAADRHLSGDDAEDRLAELLGYEFPGRGASKAEHWGIPGLLWVEQGASQEIREPTVHAGRHLHSALGESLGDALGDVASSTGDAVIRQVERQRAELLTATGKPTGEYREARRACEALENDLTRLDEQVAQYRERVDHLGKLQRDRHEIDSARPWETQLEKARAAQQRLDAVHKLQEQQEHDARALETCQRSQQLYRQQLQDFEVQAQQLERRERDKLQARQQLEQHQAHSDPVRRRLDEARAAYQRANETLNAARQHARRQALWEEQARLTEQLEQLAATLEKARALRESLQRLAEKHQAQAVDDNTLTELRNQEKTLSELIIQQRTLATRLGYALEPGQQLSLGEKALQGEGEELVLEDSELHIPGVGVLQLKPGKDADAAELLRRQRRLEADRDALLEQLGVTDLAGAEQRARAAGELAQQINQERARLEGLAPNGVDELHSQHALAVKRRDQLAEELAQLPEVENTGDLPTMAQAEAALTTAGEGLEAAEHAVAQHREALGLAEQALRSAEAEWQRLCDELRSPDRQERERQARDQLTDLKAEERRLEASLSERQKQIEAANPDVLAQDVERFTKAAEAMQEAARARESEINRLQISLETLGAQGLEEQRDNTRQELERLRRRRHQLHRRAAALDLLWNRLKTERQAVTRQLQAPLKKHLNHYLRLLFPGATVSVDEQLMPTVLTRDEAAGEEQGELDALSFGAREQMGLISRLAYADLLQEADRPTLIILDDALVHSDRDRRQQMQRILFDAARRHQILLFTCHPENWQDLGVIPRDMRSLSTDPPTTDNSQV